MPRAVDEQLGQVQLGVWDFAWSIVSYLGLAMLGIGSSVNRYVARYRASGEQDKLSSTLSSVMAVQMGIAALVALASIAISLAMPSLMSTEISEHVHIAATITLFLGLSLAVQMAFDAYRGILTGCHKWTIYNVLNAGGYAASAITMLVVLLAGGGLIGMSISYLAATTIIELIRRHLARSSLPDYRYQFRLVNREDISKVFRFGIKTILLYLPRIITQQTVMLIVATKLGPAMLAVLARPLALVAHANVLVNKFGHVLTPTAGSLQGGGKDAELKDFAIASMRAGWILAVLPVVYLMVLGDKLVDLWMGPGYANWPVVAVLAAGSLLPISQSATINIMAGMNAHGRIAKLNLYVAFLTVVIGIPAISLYGWTLNSAALLIVLPSNIGLGLVAIVIGCRVLKISGWEFMSRIVGFPVVLGLVCTAGTLATRYLGPQDSLSSVFLGAVVMAALAALMLRKELSRAYRELRSGSGEAHDSGPETTKLGSKNTSEQGAVAARMRTGSSNRLKHAIVASMDWFGLNWLFRTKNRDKLRFLTLHGVADYRAESTWVPLRSQLDVLRMRSILQALQKEYTFISIDDAVEMIDGRRPLVENAMVLTFDDGYLNNFTEALPVLEALEIPAVFYIATGVVETRKAFWFDRLDYIVQVAAAQNASIDVYGASFKFVANDREQVTEEYARMRRWCKKKIQTDEEFVAVLDAAAETLEQQCGRRIDDILEDDPWARIVTAEELQHYARNPLVTIGSHTVSHMRLSIASDADVRRELRESREKLEAWTGKPVVHFAYPNGDWDRRSRDAVEAAGYVSAVTSDSGLQATGRDRYTIRRLSIGSDDMPGIVRARASGLQRRLSEVFRQFRRA